MSGRPKTPLVLSATEREQLIALTKRRKTAQALALRARIVLACAEGLDNKVAVPPLVGALLKNEQDVSLFEKLVFMNQRNR